MRIEAFRTDDRGGVLELLAKAELPAAGVEEHFDGFFVARDAGGVVAGCIGVEVYEDVGLLRSLAVRAEQRGAGIGQLLVERLLDDAKARGLRSIYLLTTTAERFFPRFGFEEVARGEADARLGASEEFRGACPDTAVLMRREL